MSGVYGNLLQSFPELYRVTQVWTKEDKSDIRDVVLVYLSTAGDTLARWKFGNRGTALDYKDHDQIFVDEDELVNIGVGDFIYDADEQFVHRIMGEVDYVHAGGYKIFTTERVTGGTHDQTQELVVKEPTFA